MNKAEVEKFIKGIAGLLKDSHYIFRGVHQVDNHKNQEGKYTVSSTLYKKYSELEYSELIPIEKEIVSRVKANLMNYRECTNIEVLTDLLHYGLSTLLIEFSLDVYTALFFACNGEFEEDGELIMLDRSEIRHINDVDYENPTFGVIKPAQTETSRNRVTSQNSIFVYAPSGFIDNGSCVVKRIKADNKKDILNYLEKHYDISSHSIYNDLVGFISNEKNYGASETKFDTRISDSKKGETAEVIESDTGAFMTGSKREENLRGQVKAVEEGIGKLVKEQRKAKQNDDSTGSIGDEGNNGQ